MASNCACGGNAGPGEHLLSDCVRVVAERVAAVEARTIVDWERVERVAAEVAKWPQWKRDGSGIGLFAAQPAKVEAAVCPNWCGTDKGVGKVFATRATDGQWTDFKTPECQDAGRCLNPASPPAPAVAPARERQLAGDWEPVSPDDAPRACWFNDQCPRPARYKRKGLLAGCCDVHAEARGVFAPPAVAGDGPVGLAAQIAQSMRDGTAKFVPPAPSPAAVVELVRHDPSCERVTHPHSCHPCDCKPAQPPSAPTGEAQGAVTHAEAREALRVVRFVTTGAALAPEASRSLIERYIDAQEARERAEFEKQLNHDCRDNVPTHYAQRTVIERLEADLAAAKQEADKVHAQLAAANYDLAAQCHAAEAELAARKQADDDVIDQRDQLLRDCEALRAEVARLTNPFPHTFGCRCANCTAKTFQPAPATPATGANAGLARDFWNGDGGLDDLTKLLDEVTAAAEARGERRGRERALDALAETWRAHVGDSGATATDDQIAIGKAFQRAEERIRALAAEPASKGGR